MKNYLAILMLVSLILIPCINAESSYTFKSNEQKNLIVPVFDENNNPVNDSTTCFLTIVDANGQRIIDGQQMDYIGSGNFNYTFNITTMGQATASMACSDGITSGFSTFSILVNGSGQIISQQQINLLVIGLVIMLIVVAFFFILAMLFKHPGTKIFLMSLSAITLIVLIGIVAANAETYLAEFSSIVNIYHTYYIVVISLAGAAMAGIMLWLVYYAMTQFNKARGRYNEDD